MQSRKLLKIGQVLALTLISTVSLTFVDAARAETYRVEKAGYVNSADAYVEASCHPGDTLVGGTCRGDYRTLTPNGLDIDYPIMGEASGQGHRCKPSLLRTDQLVMLIVESTCQSVNLPN